MKKNVVLLNSVFDEGLIKSKFIKKIKRTPSDEILMTEILLDNDDIKIYDIATIIKFYENDILPFDKFKCYIKNNDLLIEINNNNVNIFTKSFLLNIFNFIEKEWSKKIYLYVRKEILINNKNFVKNLIFIGFKQLNNKKIKNHILFEYVV